MTDSLFKINSNGIITVDFSNIKSKMEQVYKEALGSDLNVEPSSVAGQMIANDTAVINEIQTDLTALINSFNVYTAEGGALDNAGANYGYYRKQGMATVVIATITGSAGTVIPAGSLASDGTNQYTLLDNITIPSTGSIEAEFQCLTNGPIPCVAGSLNQIVSVISGWDSVNNALDGIVGYDVENDNIFRSRITANWLNIRGKSLLGAIIDNIAQLPNVMSVIGRENPFGSAKVVDGLTLAPHSIWLTVLGGSGVDIAKTLGERKTIGAYTNGNTNINYFDENVNYNYIYKIQRPDAVNIEIQVNYEANNYTPLDIDEQIKNLIINYINNNPFMIGQTITGAELAKSLNGFNQINLLSIKVKSTGDNYQDYVNTSLAEIAVLTKENIIINKVSNG